MRAFISYSHDSAEHIAWVAEFCLRLEPEIEHVRLDKHHLGFGGDINLFMEREIVAADLVFVICTPDYVRKSDGRKGGVGYESVIISTELLRDQDSRKFIPIVRCIGKGRHTLPRFLGNRLYVDMTSGDGFGSSFNQLVDYIRVQQRSNDKRESGLKGIPATPGIRVEGPVSVSDFTSNLPVIVRLFGMDSPGLVSMDVSDLLELFPSEEFDYVRTTSDATIPDYVALAKMAAIQMESGGGFSEA